MYMPLGMCCDECINTNFLFLNQVVSEYIAILHLI